MSNLFLYGAGGHGKVVLNIAELMGVTPVAFVDNYLFGKKIKNYPILEALPNKEVDVVISIGDNKIRKSVFNNNQGYNYKTLIHPFSFLSSDILIGMGTIISSGVSICPSVIIGSHVIVNTNASLDHDCKIGNFVHISPNVALSGSVQIGEGAHIGIGSCIIPGVKIGKWSVIGAGAVVINDIPDYALVVGNPGRIIKYINL